MPIMERTNLNRRVAVLVLLAVSSNVAVAQQPTPPSAPIGPQWLNADTSRKVNQSNFRASLDTRQHDITGHGRVT